MKQGNLEDTDTPATPASLELPSPSSAPTSAIDAWSIPGDELNDMEFDPVKMVIPGLLPPGLAVLGGKPKIGKSFFTMQMAVAVAEGTMFLGETMPQGDVLVFSLEDDQRRLQGRAKALTEGDPIPRRVRMYKQENRNIKLPDIEKLIEQWAVHQKKPTLVIIDTMVKAMPKKQAGQDDYAHTTQVLGSLQALALRLDIATLLVHHTSKREDSLDDFDAFLGSTGINGTADTLMLLTRLRDSASAELSVTGRDLPEVMKIPLERDGVIWRKSGVQNYKDIFDVSPAQFKTLQVVNRLRIDGSPTPTAGDIAAAIGKSSSNTSNFLSVLKSQGFLVQPSFGTYTLATGVAEKLSLFNEASEATPITSVLDEDPMPDIVNGFDFS
ncbi:MAG: AAA family ATPase [Trueperaceae bacterium]